MRPATPLFWLSLAAVTTGLLLVPAAGGRAQPVPPPGSAQPASDVDPPTRVGRLAAVAGTVSWRASPTDESWQPASANYPLTSGNALWTEAGSRATVEVAAVRLALDGTTELSIDQLDDHTVGLTLARGRLYASLRDPAPGDVLSVTTPRGVVTLASPGRYLITAGDADAPTLVTTSQGTAQITGQGLSLLVRAGETLSLSGAGPFQASIGTARPDPFLQAEMARERPPSPAAPAVVGAMTGAEPLLTTGEWASAPDYGQVWYPPVSPGWVPYRDGHWAWVAPWGWTWIDDAPWGFAPFHYGRWVEYGGRWGWVPGAERPVYAPALVSWVDVGAGVGIGLAAGVAVGAAVGWIPLGPHEPYRPWYHASGGYLDRMNGSRGPGPSGPGGLMNRNAGTMGASGWVAGAPRPGGHWAPMTPQALAAARPVGEVPVRPSAATPGVTPGMARQVSLAPMPPGATARPMGPGPAPGGGFHAGAPGAQFHSGAPGAGAIGPATPGMTRAPVAAAHPGLPPLPPAGGGRPMGQPGAAPGAIPHAGPQAGASFRQPERGATAAPGAPTMPHAQSPAMAVPHPQAPAPAGMPHPQVPAGMAMQPHAPAAVPHAAPSFQPQQQHAMPAVQVPHAAPSFVAPPHVAAPQPPPQQHMAPPPPQQQHMAPPQQQQHTAPPPPQQQQQHTAPPPQQHQAPPAEHRPCPPGRTC